MLQKLRNRLAMMIGTAMIESVQDSEEFQHIVIELMAKEIRELESLTPYGFAHHPHAGSEGLAVFPDGERAFGYVICIADRRYRLKGLKEGEVALYDDQNQFVLLGRDGMKLSGKEISIEAERINMNGETYINGVKQLGN